MKNAREIIRENVLMLDLMKRKDITVKKGGNILTIIKGRVKKDAPGIEIIDNMVTLGFVSEIWGGQPEISRKMRIKDIPWLMEILSLIEDSYAETGKKSLKQRAIIGIMEFLEK